jgi:purine-nucleoside/S-methyl-5'-thioadenosine phosphorylase / adenosine deaminase
MPILNETRLPGPVPRWEVPGWRERFNVVAGVTGRGSGEKPFDLGLWSGQPVGEVMGRWRDLRAAEPGFVAHVLGNQVHGREIRRQEGGEGWILVPGVDGHLTATPGTMLYVTVADCIPVYLVVPGKAVALLHAGWRGTATGILERGVEAICQHVTTLPSDIVIHCGIGICGKCYEVGHEVMEGLGLGFDPNGPKPHADIRSVLADRAARLGVSRVSLSDRCSAHERTEFFSHRASGGGDGRMVAYLGMIA